MSYTAIEKMRVRNFELYGKDVGPFQPSEHYKQKSFDLKSSALRFLHERCETLKFDYEKEKQEQTDGTFLGKSIDKNQIPYNMQMDVNRLCLERELERFIDSGVAEDAYNVYYCYMEMFLGYYGKSKKMVELLSEFESNGSSLLMKHRDHYSHSVYVFALGLAIYETNVYYRSAFKEFYGFDKDDSNAQEDHKAANFYLETWGLASLFHDIGYPFELPFEQVLSYFEVDNKKRGKGSIYIAYRDVNPLISLTDEVKVRLKELYGREFNNTIELFSYDLAQKLNPYYGITEEKLNSVLSTKPLSPDSYGYFMDHAWFSANRLFQELTKPDPITEKYSLENIKKEHVDAISAILLHNSLFKFSIAFYKDKDENGNKLYPSLKMKWHPLAYMLMLCDELQCWDRTAYGRNSRKELHPMSAVFDFSQNNISVSYIYDCDEQDKIDKYKDDYKRYLEDCVRFYKNEIKDMPEQPSLKAFGSMYETQQSFRTDIENIVELNVQDGIKFSVKVKTEEADRSAKHTYLSGSNFLHLYDFAVSLNARYNHEDKEDETTREQIEDEFESLSLEYKLSNINQAKSFSKYLNVIGCFYTDKPVDFPMLDHFTAEQTASFAPLEHKRWVLEHQWMGWKCGSYYESEEAHEKSGGKYSVKQLREQMRMHKLTMDGKLSDDEINEHYDLLPEEDKGKDWKPFNSMLKLIKKFDGLRIYELQ